MNNDNSSIKNLISNLTTKQKIGIGVFLVVVIIIIIIFAAMINNVEEDISGEEQGKDSESSTVVGEGIKWDDQKNTEAEGGNSGQSNTIEVPVSVEYNSDHKYTLADHLPSSDYDYVRLDNGDRVVREYWIAEENTAIDKGIVVSVESCNADANTAAANEYLKSLPVNLSDYIIVYQTRTSDFPCDTQPDIEHAYEITE